MTIMNSEEAAVLMKIPVYTLNKRARKGELPAKKIGKHWRFIKEILEKWLEDEVRASPRRMGAK